MIDTIGGWVYSGAEFVVHAMFWSAGAGIAIAVSVAVLYAAVVVCEKIKR